MKLSKQLWLLISLLLVTAFVGSFMFSSLNIRNYVEEQLQLKNSDTANALALTISQSEKDRALIETFMATQFDMGHFRHISLEPVSGEPIVFQAGANTAEQQAPGWFQALLPLDSPTASARIMSGWNEYGLIRVSSATDDAYELLWSTVQRTLMWLLFLLVLVAVAARYLVRTITGPLDGVVRQAEAIGNQQFIEGEEPNTDELRRVARAMNRLAAKVKAMLARERNHVEDLRFALQHDELTGLPNRKVLMQSLEQLLSEGSAEDQHGLLLLRVLSLNELNQRLGRKGADDFLCQVAEVLQEQQDSTHDNGGTALAARLNGSDFALLFHDRPDLHQLVEVLNHKLDAINQQTLDENRPLPVIMAGEWIRGDEQRASVMIRVDALLAKAELEWPEQNCLLSEATQETDARSVDQWRSLLTGALANERTRLTASPVYSPDGDYRFEDLTAELSTEEGDIPISQFGPWARRFGLESEFDQQLLTAAIGYLEEDSQRQVAVRLSQEALDSVAFVSAMTGQLRHSPELASRLTLAIRETAAFANVEKFTDFSGLVTRFGCRVALVDASTTFLASDLLPTLGLSFIHLDSNVASALDQDQEEALFIQRVCSVAHSVGMTVIMDEMTGDQNRRATQCGVDGFRKQERLPD